MWTLDLHLFVTRHLLLRQCLRFVENVLDLLTAAAAGAAGVEAAECLAALWDWDADDALPPAGLPTNCDDQLP
eukprot:3554703-Prorocentrum_lima.AAC.1